MNTNVQTNVTFKIPINDIQCDMYYSDNDSLTHSSFKNQYHYHESVPQFSFNLIFLQFDDVEAINILKYIKVIIRVSEDIDNTNKI